jgi:hypothetical protein
VNRTLRVSLLLVLLIVLASTAGALAFRGAAGTGGESPEAAEGAGDNVERVVERLGDAGITTDATELEALADAHGIGGAVRILAFAGAAGVDPSEIVAMRDDGMGWGQIRRALAEAHEGFDLPPGIGWIMGGNGQGEGHGQGGDDAGD